jgi:ABC-type sugar transport system ATPase subunit
VNDSPIIVLRSISKRFGNTQALKSVSLTVCPGEIHALIGENGAGKSTLINIMAGEVQPDEGEMLFEQRRTVWPDPHAAGLNGISVVYQELSLCPNLTAAENIGLAWIAAGRSWQLANRTRMRRTAQKLLSDLGFADFPVDVPVHRLSLSKRQIVEIAKALAAKVRLLILDEPNSALTLEESAKLFGLIKHLRERAVAVVYVSHRLEETLELADRITILRDGQLVETGKKTDYSIDELIRKMVGREVDRLFQRSSCHQPDEEEILAVAGLSDSKLLRNVSFSIRRGEILGLAGLPNSGKDELIECLCGLCSFNGQITIKGASAKIRNPGDLIRRGLSLVPSDRRGAGTFPLLSIRDNIVSANLTRVSRLGIIQRRRAEHLAGRYLKRIKVKARSIHQRISTLSGGNQQKVILARNLASEPLLLLMHEPTRGIDVGAKADIYQILNQLVQDGIAILIVSSELPELMGQCDRILTMRSGQISGEHFREHFSEESILATAMCERSISDSRNQP